MYSYEDIFKDKKTILVVVAHPDDLDFYFGGTLARLRKDNIDVHCLITTNGARGSRENTSSEDELAAIRHLEQETALRCLGVKHENYYCLNYKDGEVDNTFKFIGEIAKYIRKTRCDLVMTFEPHCGYLNYLDKGTHYINHRDHRITGMSTLDAIYPFSRDRSFFTEHYSENLLPHTVKDIVLTNDLNKNAKIDITEVIEQKRNALLSHHSQFSVERVNEMINERIEEGRHYEYMNYIKLEW